MLRCSLACKLAKYMMRETAKRSLTHQELRALDLLDQRSQSGLDVGPCDPLLCGGVRDGLQALLVQDDDALEHADLIQCK